MKTQKSAEGSSDLKTDQKEYVTVLGDTVYGRDMIITIMISSSLGLGGFLFGKQIFPGIAPENMVDSYSLLVGIAGLVIAFMINSILFKPKRKVAEEESAGDKVTEIFEEAGLSIEEEREAIRNNLVVLKEIKEQGIYHTFFPKEDSE